MEHKRVPPRSVATMKALEPGSLHHICGSARNALIGSGIASQLLWRLLVAFASWVGIGDAGTTFLTPLH